MHFLHVTQEMKKEAFHKFSELMKSFFFILGGRLHHAAHMVLSCNIFNAGRRKSRRISILQALSVISLTLIYFVLLDFVSKMLACY
jgi:hypothetical protein